MEPDEEYDYDDIPCEFCGVWVVFPCSSHFESEGCSYSGYGDEEEEDE